MMAAVRGADTGPEKTVRRALHQTGFRFRLHARDLPGRPDIVLPKHCVAIFVHGCFWHRHEGCRRCTTPKANRAFWTQKFSRNLARDHEACSALERAGWRIAIVWECALKPSRTSTTMALLARWIVAGGARFETTHDSPESADPQHARE